MKIFLAYLRFSRTTVEISRAVVGLFVSVSFPIIGFWGQSFSQLIIRISSMWISKQSQVKKLEVTDTQIGQVENLLRKEDPEIVKLYDYCRKCSCDREYPCWRVRLIDQSRQHHYQSQEKRWRPLRDLLTLLLDRLRASLKNTNSRVKLTVVELKWGPQLVPISKSVSQVMMRISWIKFSKI